MGNGTMRETEKSRRRFARPTTTAMRTSGLWLVLCAAILVGLPPSLAHAQPDGGRAGADGVPFGRRIRVALPIAGSSDLVIKQMIQRTLDQAPAGEPRPVIVFEFWSPPGSSGAGSEFERSLALARFLISPALDRVRTVAYIPESVTGHAVLVALACEQIIMGPDAVLGDAGEAERTVGPTVRGGYSEIATSRRTIPEAIALGMLDPQLEISRVTTGSGVLYAWPEELEKLRRQRNDIEAIDTVIPADRLGKFRGDELRRMGFVSYLASDLQEVASLLDLPGDQLEFDPSAGGEWRPIRLELSGPVTAQAVERIQRTIQQQREAADINFVCLQIESPGGSAVESVRLANFLADLDQSRVRTVAYVPGEARADAMIVAFACDHLVVGSDAILGGGGAVRITDEVADDLLLPLQEIADRKARDWSLLAAMLDPRIVVYRYEQAGTNQVKYLSEEEFEAKYAPQELQAAGDEPAVAGAWKRGEPISSSDQLLQLSGGKAEQLGMARYVADDFDQLQQLYQLPGAPPLIGPNWAFDLIDALASPQLAGLLLFIGGFALISELSSPGLGIGGFLSAVCFVLYFWSNFLHGTAEVLEILLFLTGLACIAIEIFVIPGFGVFGLGGGALVVASLVLASQTFVLPSNDYQVRQLTRSLAVVTMAGAGVFTSLIVLRRYLHRAPVLGRMMLVPPEGEEHDELARRETVVDYRFLLGETGTARTRLGPSGKAVFGDYVVDVITEGELIAKGSPVIVIEAGGNRVVVRGVESDEVAMGDMGRPG